MNLHSPAGNHILLVLLFLLAGIVPFGRIPKSQLPSAPLV